MKNSIRLILAALIISGVTYAAAGSPAPTSVEASNTASALIALHTP